MSIWLPPTRGHHRWLDQVKPKYYAHNPEVISNAAWQIRCLISASV